jgi:hypothetical protein
MLHSCEIRPSPAPCLSIRTPHAEKPLEWRPIARLRYLRSTTRQGEVDSGASRGRGGSTLHPGDGQSDMMDNVSSDGNEAMPEARVARRQRTELSACLVRPPDDVALPASQPVLFLAGPIQGAPDWQCSATRMVHDLVPGLVVASPRRDYARDGIAFSYEAQVDWETRWLRRAAAAGVILFWLAAQVEKTPERAYAQTSRWELGEWSTRASDDPGIQLVVGIEDGFTGARYIRHRLGQEAPAVPVVDRFSTAIELAATLTSSLPSSGWKLRRVTDKGSS